MNVLWQRHNFTHSSVEDESLLELDLTYYPGGDLSQGLRLSFEEGYRAAVGDSGPVVLLGYMINT
ncbi:MAG: hypothetical protein ACI8QS_001690 [Planctomycetota bacterium]|jgi:hypothetical protein